jgi:hypothetical protein
MVQWDRILFFIILAIALVVFILAIVQLINIHAISGYSTNSTLQSAYSFSIGVLVINLFVLIFMIVATIYFARAHFLNSQALTLLTYLIMFSVLGSVVLAGYASVASKETVTIVNLVLMIIEFIIIVIFLFLLRRIKKVEVTLGICTCGNTVVAPADNSTQVTPVVTVASH